MAFELNENNSSNAQAKDSVQTTQAQANEPKNFTNLPGGERPANSRPVLGGGLLGNLSILSATSGNANATLMRKTIEELLKKEASNSPYTIRFLDLPPSSDLAGFIVTGQVTGNDEVVAFLPVLIDGTSASGHGVRTVKLNIEGMRTLEMQVLGTDYANDIVRDDCTQLVASRYSSSSVAYSGIVVVPKDFAFSDENAVLRLAAPVTSAIIQELAIRLETYTPLVLSELKGVSGLKIEQNFSPTQVIGDDGIPVRVDAMVDMYYSEKSGQQNGMPNGGRTQHISRIGMFLEMVYSPRQPRNSLAALVQQGNRDCRTFIPRVVIDLLETNIRTPERIAFALATAFTIADGGQRNWLMMLKPTGVRGGVRAAQRNIGVLNFEAGIGAETDVGYSPVPANGSEYTLKEIADFASLVIEPNAVFAIDIPDASPNAPFLQILGDIARGNQNAYREFYNSVNVLTGRQFEKYFPFGTNIFNQAATDRFFIGSYTDAAGEADLRTLDYTAICNILGASNIDMIREYMLTTTNLSEDARVRSERLRSMLENLTQGTMKLHGRGIRATFTQEFVVGITSAIRDMSLKVDVVNPNTAGFGTQNTGATYLLDSIVNMNMRAFNGGGNVSNGGMGSGLGNVSSRW